VLAGVVKRQGGGGEGHRLLLRSLRMADGAGNNPLHLAVRHGNVPCLRSMLAAYQASAAALEELEREDRARGWRQWVLHGSPLPWAPRGAPPRAHPLHARNRDGRTPAEMLDVRQDGAHEKRPAPVPGETPDVLTAQQVARALAAHFLRGPDGQLETR